MPELLDYNWKDPELEYISALKDEKDISTILGILADNLLYKHKFKSLAVPVTKYILRSHENVSVNLKDLRKLLLNFARSKSMYKSLAYYGFDFENIFAEFEPFLDFESEIEIFKHVYTCPTLRDRFFNSDNNVFITLERLLPFAILTHYPDAFSLLAQYLKPQSQHMARENNISVLKILENILIAPNVPETEYPYLFKAVKEFIDRFCDLDDYRNDCHLANEIRYGDRITIDTSGNYSSKLGFYAHLAKKTELLDQILKAFDSTNDYCYVRYWNSYVDYNPEIFVYLLKYYKNTDAFHYFSINRDMRNFAVSIAKHYIYSEGFGEIMTFDLAPEYEKLNYPRRLNVNLNANIIMPYMRFYDESGCYNYVSKYLEHNHFVELEFGPVNIKYLLESQRLRNLFMFNNLRATIKSTEVILEALKYETVTEIAPFTFAKYDDEVLYNLTTKAEMIRFEKLTFHLEM